VINLATQSGISIVQTQAGLTGWADEGSGKTNFKTSVWIEDSTGKKITASELSPMPIWDTIPPNCKMKYKVETISKGKGRSDKFQLDIQFTDYSAIMRVLERVKGNLTQEQLERYESGSKLMEDSVNKMVAQILSDEQIPVTKTIYSKQLNTDDDGKLEGEIDISQWPLSEYNIMFQYGYRGDRESRTNWDEMWANVGDTALFVGSIALAFIPGIGWGAAAAILAADVAVSVALEMMRAYGEVTENKYGVSFPQYGFLHPYAFGMYGEKIDQENQGVIKSLTNATNANDTIKIGGIILLAVLLLRRLIK